MTWHGIISAVRRDITDAGLIELTQLRKMQTLVINNMSSNVTGTFLNSLQGDTIDSWPCMLQSPLQVRLAVQVCVQ